MGIFSKKEKPKAQDTSVGEVALGGHALHVNPGPAQVLIRNKARLARIKKRLEDGKQCSPEKQALFEKEIRGLEMAIKLEQGDY